MNTFYFCSCFEQLAHMKTTPYMKVRQVKGVNYASFAITIYLCLPKTRLRTEWALCTISGENRDSERSVTSHYKLYSDVWSWLLPYIHAQSCHSNCYHLNAFSQQCGKDADYFKSFTTVKLLSTKKVFQKGNQTFWMTFLFLKAICIFHHTCIPMHL